MRVPSFGSLRVRLVVFILGVSAAVLCASGVVVYVEADRESQQLFDESLQEAGHLLFTLAEHEAEEMRTTGASHLIPMISNHQPYLFFQIWTENGRLLYRNNGAPDEPFVGGGRTGLGWFDRQGERWRTFALWNNTHTLHMQVGEPLRHRKETSIQFAIQLIVLAAIILPLLGAMIWWIVHRSFEPLRRSTDEVGTRTPGDLRAVDAAKADEEVRPLFAALNHLFGRMRQALEREQRFTADAAHELRTPLAGIKTNLQVLTRARNADEQGIALAGLTDSTERAIRLVDQLLTLARIEPDQVMRGSTIDLAALVRRQAGEHDAAARARRIRLSTQCDAATVAGNEASLAIMLRNLLDNALRHTPEGGEVTVSCGRVNGRVELAVSDSGTGIPAALHERVFERFFRAPGDQPAGSGLGLSIVRSIADLHAATIRVSDGIGKSGTTITLSFPPVA
ncbi:MAG: ATP-binding protein [Betaproteobacteria bacterium]